MTEIEIYQTNKDVEYLVDRINNLSVRMQSELGKESPNKKLFEIDKEEKTSAIALLDELLKSIGYHNGSNIFIYHLSRSNDKI